MNKHVSKVAFSGIAMLGCWSCSPTEPVAGDTAVATPPAPATAAADPVTLPISINEVMVAMVDDASEPLWIDAYEPPTTDAGWREAEHHAYQMAVSGKLIQLAGTGPNDDVWVEEKEWRDISNEMTAAGMDALAAAQARNVGALNTAGDRLVAACEACHKIYKPDLTTMGKYKSPDFPARD